MNTSSKWMCIFLHVDTCMGKTSSSELFGAWLVTQVYITVVLGKGMCVYIGSVVYNTMNFVLLWAAITPLCLVIGTNAWLGEQKHSTAYVMEGQGECLLRLTALFFASIYSSLFSTILDTQLKIASKQSPLKITPECTETALWTVTACFMSSPPQQL